MKLTESSVHAGLALSHVRPWPPRSPTATLGKLIAHVCLCYSGVFKGGHCADRRDFFKDELSRLRTAKVACCHQMRFLAGKCSKMRLRPRWGSLQRSQTPHQRLICRKNSDLGYQALVHSVGAILLSTTLPRAIFACNFLNVPDAACSPGHFHNIVLIICQFSTVLLSILFSNSLYSNNHHHHYYHHIQVVRT